MAWLGEQQVSTGRLFDETCLCVRREGVVSDRAIERVPAVVVVVKTCAFFSPVCLLAHAFATGMSRRFASLHWLLPQGQGS